LGQIYEIISDQHGDLGADDNGNFIPLSEMNLNHDNAIEVKPAFPKLKKAKGITVNQVAGSKKLIDRRRKLYQADIESMEGLAVFKFCSNLGIPCAQVRAISNFVEPRNKENWEIDLAIQNLNKFMLEFINSLQ